MPHLERWSHIEEAWIEVPRTKHNYDPNSKSRIGQVAHGIMEDLEGEVREVPDSAGQCCCQRKKDGGKITDIQSHTPTRGVMTA